MRYLTAICLAFVFFFASPVFATWMDLNPSGPNNIYPSDINKDPIFGDVIAGSYTTADSYPNRMGFVLKIGEFWHTFTVPGAVETVLTGVSRGRAVGNYTDASGGLHGVLYDIEHATWQHLDPPDSTASLYDIDIVSVIGFDNSSAPHAFFVYSTATGEFNYLKVPGKSGRPEGISGSKIVGNVLDAQGLSNAFVMDTNTLGAEFLVKPGADANSTSAQGVYGELIVGSYSDSLGKHGFVYNHATSEWTTIDAPAGGDTVVYGIYGDTIVGTYNGTHGFYATLPAVPEPSVFGLLLCGALTLVGHRLIRAVRRKLQCGC